MNYGYTGYLPILYEAGETAFDNLGLGYCDCISCEVSETMNALDDYICTMVYPATGILANEFTEGRVLLVVQDDTEAALSDRETFVIYNTNWSMADGTITVYAMQEAVYRAKYMMLSVVPATSGTAAARATALTGHPGWDQGGFNEITLEVSADFDTTSFTWAWQEPQTLLDSIQTGDNSLLAIAGGELKAHRRTITLCKSRGSDNGAIVRYGKNLSALTIETNAAAAYDGVLPYWKKTDSDTNETTCITGDSTTGGQIVYSSTKETAYHHVIAVDVTSDLKKPDEDEDSESTDDEEETEWTPTPAEVYAAGKAHLADLAPGTISVVYNATITQDPDDPAIELCDTVLVQHPTVGLNQKMQVTSRTFNPLLRRHTSLGIGSVEKSLTRAIKDLVR